MNNADTKIDNPIIEELRKLSYDWQKTFFVVRNKDGKFLFNKRVAASWTEKSERVKKFVTKSNAQFNVFYFAKIEPHQALAEIIEFRQGEIIIHNQEEIYRKKQKQFKVFEKNWISLIKNN